MCNGWLYLKSLLSLSKCRLDSHTHSSFEHATAIQMLISVMDGVPCRLSKGGCAIEYDIMVTPAPLP